MDFKCVVFQFVLVQFKGEEGILQKREKNYNDILKIKNVIITVHFSMNLI